MADPVWHFLQSSLGSAYTLQRELGQGGMSRVFVARDEALGRDVVVKVLAPELAEGLSAERFAREIRLAAGLQEPHIVPVLTAGGALIDRGPTGSVVPYYTMPFVRGDSLRHRLEEGPVPLAEAVAVLRDVARALAYAHAQGVVHRDIKPENVLLSSGTAVVTDFGIAKALTAAGRGRPQHPQHTAKDLSTLTLGDTPLGTPAYMAPEQALGEAVDHRADLYAWGVVAYELLAGRHPFAGKAGAQQLIAAHIAEAPVPLADAPGARGVPPELAALVMRCLAKAPAARPADAGELVAALERVVAGPVSRGPAARRSRRVVRWALVVLAAAAGVAVGVRSWQRTGTSGARRAPAVAVLPFDNLNGDTASAYISDGLTEELIDVLERARVFRVASRATSFSYRGRHVDPRHVAEATRADAVLTGSVRRAGDRLRVVAELARGTDGRRLWGETYDRTSSDAIAIEEEIARAIASSLRVTLAPRGSADVRVDATAYDEYLRARQMLNPPHMLILVGVRPQVERAIALLEHAVAADTSFARAWALLGRAYIAMCEYVPPRAVMPKASAAVQRAVQLDPTNAEVALSRASILLNYEWDWAAAEREYRRALALDPMSAQAHRQYAFFLSLQRRGEDGIRETLRANELELQQATDAGAFRALHETNLGNAHALAGHYDEARRHFAEALRLAPGSAAVNWGAGRWLATLGDPPGAVRAMEVARRQLGDQLPLLTHVGIVYGLAGRPDSTRRILRTLEGRARTEYIPKDQIAALYLALGDRRRALSWLERAIDEGHYWMPATNNSPWFLRLHDDPQFRGLMRRIHVPEQAL